MTTFIWCARLSTVCAKMAWSQNEGMRSGEKVIKYLRNATGVTAIDEAEGSWIEVAFSDGSAGRLEHFNSPDLLRDGHLILTRGDSTEVIVARGLTEIMSPEGYTLPMFKQLRPNAVQIAYRVVEPVKSDSTGADDADIAAMVRVTACLRNYVE